MKIKMLVGAALAVLSLSGLAAVSASAYTNPGWQAHNALWICPDSYAQKMQELHGEEWTEEEIVNQPPGGALPVDQYCGGIVLPQNPDLIEAVAKQVTACAEVNGVTTQARIEDCIDKVTAENPDLSKLRAKKHRHHAKRHHHGAKQRSAAALN